MEEPWDADSDIQALSAAVRRWLARFPADAPVIVVPVYEAYADVIECVESVLATTDPAVPFLVVDDGSSDGRIPALLARLAAERGFHYARKLANDGFVGTMNLAFDWTAPRDVILLNSDVIVPPRWVGRLHAAAYARTTIATATPLTNHGSIVSVPERNTPANHLPRGFTIDEFDRRIRDSSLTLYPVIPTAIGHCVYFKRSALTTVGIFDPAFSPGYGEEVDFSQRAVMLGFCHVLADDLFVFHKGSRSFASERSQTRDAALRRVRQTHERRIAIRYPWYHPWVRVAEHDAHGPLARAIAAARMATLGERIAIDATSINDTVTGTQMATLELVRALCLSKPEMARVALIVNDGLDRRHLDGVDDAVDAVVTMSALRDRSGPPFDLLHRPFQVHSVDQLRLLRRAAHRCVVTHLDFISFANPGYFPSAVEWLRYRSLTKNVLDTADGVVYISEDAMRDAKHQGLAIPDERTCVTHLGIDHQAVRETGKGPPHLASLRETPFIAVLGTNFRHKNRVYALRMYKALVERHGWAGDLVFAGPRVFTGSSETEEALERIENAALSPRIHYLEQLDEGDKWWLLRHAALVLYPSIVEGFGLVPFEAAAVGTPTLSTRCASLDEVLGNDVLSLELFDIDTDAETAWSVLSDARLAARQVERVQERGNRFTWRSVAETTWDFYGRVLRMPRRPPPDPTEIGELSQADEKQWQEYRALQRWALTMQDDYLTMQDDYQRLERWAQDLNSSLAPERPGIGLRLAQRLRRRATEPPSRADADT